MARVAEPDEISHLKPEARRSVAGIAADQRQPATWVEHEAVLVRQEVGVGLRATRPRRRGQSPDLELVRRIEGSLRQIRSPYVELSIAKPLQIDDLAPDLSSLDQGLGKIEWRKRRGIDGRPKLFELHSSGQVGGGGTQDVACVERGRHRLEHHLRRRDLNRSLDSSERLAGQNKQPVVGADEEPTTCASIATSRSAPTLGSTIDTSTASLATYANESTSSLAAAMTLSGGRPCERSTIRPSGAILAITAWQIPTHSFR